MTTAWLIWDPIPWPTGDLVARRTTELLEGIESGSIDAAAIAAMTVYEGDSASDFEDSVSALQRRLRDERWTVVGAGRGLFFDWWATVMFVSYGSSGGDETFEMIQWSDVDGLGLLHSELLEQ